MEPEQSVQPDSPLAQIVTILSLAPIPNADKIELATVLGWEVVVQKSEFNVGDLAIYFSIGSILPTSNPNTAFLEGKVLKTRKIRRVLSQGLLGSISWLASFGVTTAVAEGDNVTDLLGVRKWVATEEMSLYESASGCGGPFPQLIPKTDEPRVQNCPKRLRELENQPVVITQKYDGTSYTILAYDGKVLVCNRNNIVAPDSNTPYAEITKRYNLIEKLTQLGKNLAIQGEIIGPKINGNRHKVPDKELFVFNIYDANAHTYMSWDAVLALTTQLGLKTVPVVYRGIMKPDWLTVPALLELSSSQLYDTGVIAEGIVVKSDYGVGGPRTSFKVISNKYLLKYDL